MRRTRRLLLLLFAFFAILLVWLVFTNSGLGFIVARALPADGSVRVAALQGTVWSGVRAQGVQIELPTMRLSIGDATADFALGALWRGALRLRSVKLDGVQWLLRDVAANQRAPSAAPPDLPALRIDALQVVSAEIARGDGRWVIDRVDARVVMRGRDIAIDRLQMLAPMGRANGSVALDLARDLPLRAARLEVDVTVDDRRIVAALEARTDRGVTGLTLAVQQPVLAAISVGAFRAIDDWNAFVQVPEQRVQDAIPIAASLQVQVQQRAVRVTGDARYDALALPSIDVTGRIDDDAFVLASSTFAFASPQGRVALQGRVPFAASAPITLAVRSDDLSFASSDAPDLRVAGALQVSGSRDALALTPDLTLARAGWPVATLAGRVRQHTGLWTAEDLRLQSDRSAVHLDGELPVARDVPATLALRLARFDPALFAPEWPGAIDADLVWHGHLGEQGLEGELVVERLEGVLRERALRGDGTLVLRAGELATATLEMAAGASTLQVLRDAPGAPLRLEFESPDLADLMPDWHGRVRASAQIDRDWRIQADLGDVVSPRFALAEARVQAAFGADAQSPVGLNATLRGLVVADQRLDRVQASVEGTRAAHRLDLDVQAGARQVQLAAEGGLGARDAWRGELTGLDLLAPEWRASLIAPAVLTRQAGQLSLSRSCLGNEAGGRLCLQFAQDGLRTEWSSELVALDLRPLWALLAPNAPFATEARLSGSVDARLMDGALQSLNARLDSAEGAMRVEARPDLDLGYRDFALDLRIDEGVGAWSASAVLRPEGRVESKGQLRLFDGEWQYEGELHANVHRFDAIEAFTSQLASPRGDMSGDMQFRGRGWERPQWSGAFAVTGFAAELPELGLQLSNGALAFAAVPTGIIVRGAITSGGGQLILDGGRDADANARWHFELNGADAELADTPALRLVLSPALTLQQREGDWLLGGRVRISEALIDAEVLAPPSSLSSDVVIVDADAAALDATRWNADVVVTLGDRVKLVGFGFDGLVRGDLRLRQRSGDNAYGQGQLQVSGRYAAYGQRLTIRRGRVLFANSPLDEPTLDIEAERKAGSAVAGVRVTGTARRPQTDIYSRPAMSESEALALIVTGRGLRGVSGADRQRLSNAALALGTIGGDLLATSLGAEIGITGDAARGTEAFTIGKYLTPKLFVGYGIGLARSGSVLIVRYLIRDDVEFEAISGEQSRASLNYIIEK